MRNVSCLFLTILSIFALMSCSENSSKTSQGIETTVADSGSKTLPKLPTEMTLFGETILLDNFDIKERLDKEVIVNTHFHSSTIQILKKSNRFFPQIEQILKEENVPDDLKYLCVIESALNQATSPSGAKGFWQFMPGTAKEFGLEVNKEIDERMHIEKSTRAACDYLKRAKSSFDNWISASASYNCGVGGLKSVMKEQGNDNFFELFLNRETSRYVFRIMALKLILENPEAYGFFPEEMELYEPIRGREIQVTKSISNLSEWAKNQGTNLRILKVMNPWLVSNRLIIRDKKYVVILPKE